MLYKSVFAALQATQPVNYYVNSNNRHLRKLTENRLKLSWQNIKFFNTKYGGIWKHHRPFKSQLHSYNYRCYIELNVIFRSHTHEWGRESVWEEGCRQRFEGIVTEFTRGDWVVKSTEIRTWLLHRSEGLRYRSSLYSMIHTLQVWDSSVSRVTRYWSVDLASITRERGPL